MSLEITGIDCLIDKTVILNKVSFSVPTATMCAIVGVNGAGKSTMLRTIALTPPMGVRIDGIEISTLHPKQRARQFSFVGQEDQPPADLTVAEAVGLGRLPFLKPWQLGAEKERVIIDEALVKVGLAGLGDRMCSDLSGGQRKRVILARAFAQDTPVMFLDEPTNHLDVQHQLSLLDVLRSSGKTIVSTIHDLDLAYSHFDQVILVHGGTIHASGTPVEVLTTNNVSATFGVHAMEVHGSYPHLVIEEKD
ncbi:putative iron ABC transport system ATP-binding protein [Corynebacterium kutscheri]|uniref:ABC-type cobalamin/Fe3+-siderophore transport system, ATPase component n=1 Tax=Corynebacterium kutscheri TaxID=35755 RepID=A0A0F6QZ89_9CORY|nr:ABC transporter ATP-binding protein [Corynebacterium kutscheri]AKE41007.1 ABC-type cobalamin/Fe3+-siderophore transport system, ATPase component [Corynebacterium kutscheri]VEH06897.1 putative iron ABC transport system ATP-binding protein [Corynebacterium kutscheri]VEH09305.1 putative iron ABC transport system ATP-binding protein [Corynebacterium kutscheri]VEH79393.1 putative iron ABC transport system ATP-binding protein [Corynebacterium kutscheri]